MQEPREFRVDIGDVELSVVEWPGDGNPILLLHATGFHSRCWGEVVRRLPGRHVHAVDLRFHGASGESGEISWDVMAEDIRILVERLELRNIVGAGHSIGGHLIARAAAALPASFRHLVLIDPVIMAPETYRRFSELRTDLRAEDHPVSRRKNAWRDAQEMFERFQDREPFSTWDPAVLRDYCDYALRPADEDEVRRLACDPINEAGIYMSDKGSEVLLGQLGRITMPVTLLRAPPSENELPDFASSPTWPELAAALPDCREVYLPDMNHFIPMQDPALVARYIGEVC